MKGVILALVFVLMLPLVGMGKCVDTETLDINRYSDPSGRVEYHLDYIIVRDGCEEDGLPEEIELDGIDLDDLNELASRINEQIVDTSFKSK